MRFQSQRNALIRKVSPNGFCMQSTLRRNLTSCRKSSRFNEVTHVNTFRNQFRRSYQLVYSSTHQTPTSTPQSHVIKRENETKRWGSNSVGDENSKLWLECLGNYYSVAIDEEGKAISLTIKYGSAENASTDSWKYSSALLWVNDPEYIHESSGQRIRTLGQYSNKFAVSSARVFYMNADDEELSIENAKINPQSECSPRKLHPIPPRGSLHSRGGIYSDKSSSRRSGRILLKLEWNYGQESIFDLDWLIDHARNNCLNQSMSKNIVNSSKDTSSNDGYNTSRHGIEAAMTTSKVTKEIAIGRKGNSNAASIAKFDYEEILENDDILLHGMQEIFEHGAILVQNAPDVEDVESSDKKLSMPKLESIVGNLGKRFSGGNLSHQSLYGDVFHVQSKEDAQNIAYTNLALPPHQDLTYYESKPFLQLLHCSTNTVNGGESVLIDAMAAAEELRHVATDHFDVLCKTEATFIKERHDADMVSPKPHIVLDRLYGQIVEINWSPPFEGPLQLHPRISTDDYVRAYHAIECMLDDDATGSSSYVDDEWRSSALPESLESYLREYAKEYTWEQALQKGNILVFNNQRMLHGRRSFESDGNGKRHLIGCYTDAIDTISRYRQLLRWKTEKNGGGYGKRNPGNGCRWM